MRINKNVIHPEVLKFIKTHEEDDIVKLILKGSPFKEVDIQKIAQQIKGRQVAKAKFPNLYKHHSIIYPPKINLEQASSQTTATYKAQCIKSSESIIDLTGGFGIDALAFAKQSQKVYYCEINLETFEYAEHNFKILNKDITALKTDGIEYLSHQNLTFDWVYLDPARRDKNGQKVTRLEDSTPNVLEHLELLKSKSKCLLLKTSPLLDINLCIKQIPSLKEVHIVAVKNEVKELLFIIDFDHTKKNPTVHAVNLQSPQDNFRSSYNKKDTQQLYTDPQTYLYEPNAALMKSGFFGEIGQQYKLKALAKHTHLFTSKTLIEFPGRRFKIKQVISPQKKLIKKLIPDLKANVSSRNYPIKPDQIKNKYGIKDGGQDYLFFTTNHKNKKIVLFCHKIHL